MTNGKQEGEERLAPTISRVPTRILGFDTVAAGGLPAGRTTLLSGSAGSGKTVFGLQYLALGAREFDDPGVMVSFIERPEDLIANTRSFGWDLADLVRSDRVRILDAAPASDSYVAGAFDFSALSARIEHAIRETGAKRLVLDPLDALLSEFGEEASVRRELTAVVRNLRSLGVTTLITAEQPSGPGYAVARHGFEEFLTDNVITVRNTLDREVRRRTIEVLKFRGAEHQKGQYPFVIDSATGIEVLPVSVIEEEPEAAEERLVLGEPGLDAMVPDGVYRDALILVSGATGTGKTLMALQFLRAGLDAGERAVMLSFEESAAQIIRNAASWGWDIGTPVAEGRLKIVSRYPERMGLEDLLVSVKREVEEIEPSRLALDGLSALETNAPAKGYREFAVGLTGYLKPRQVATMLTSTREGLTNGGGATEAHMSTITDVIIVLKYIDLEGELDRGLVVVKMRGGAHSKAVPRYRIAASGMHVGEPSRGVSGILRGAAEYVGSEVRPRGGEE